MTHLLRVTLLTACLTLPAAARDPVLWPLPLIDPAATEGSPADLVLPMPCGAAMAFQRVDVPTEAADPLSDRRIQLGLGSDSTGYSDYLKPAFLRGPFENSETGGTHYYIARYELTQGQARVLRGDCRPPRIPADRLAQGELSWFDAVNLTQTYTSWLYANAPDVLPRRDGAPAFLRLPTETEWEYATRGGAAVDPTVFPALHFFTDGTLPDHGIVFAPGSGAGQIFPVGLRLPNPLGLYDVYGNVEELMLEPFRLNILGREHGQSGGIVTRGGSTFDAPEQIYSAARREYSPFNPRTGHPRMIESFGMRLVITAHVTSSDSQLQEIQSAWQALAGSRDAALEVGAGRADPQSRIATLMDAELDPRRKRALAELQFDIRQAQAATDIALTQSANASLLAGAAFVEAINRTAAEMESLRSNVLTILDIAPAGDINEMFQRQISTLQSRLGDERELQCTLLTSYRSTLTALTTEIESETRHQAYGILREELILSNRTLLLSMLDEFWLDIALFELRPDTDTLGLLEFALTRPVSDALRTSTRC